MTPSFFITLVNLRRLFFKACSPILLLGAYIGCLACTENSESVQSNNENSDFIELFTLELLSTRACPTPDIESNPDRQLLSFEVRLSSKSTIPVNYRYASLITKDGNRYLAEYFGCQPLFNSKPLGASTLESGFLNFALPAGKEALRIEYAPDLTHLEAQRTKSLNKSLVFELSVTARSSK